MIQEAEGREPSIETLTAILRNFQNGSATLWVATTEKKMIAFFVTSKYFGGPAQCKTMYITYLRGMERIPKATYVQTLGLLREHAQQNGCSMLMATVQDERLLEVAKELGADVDFRVTWRI